MALHVAITHRTQYRYSCSLELGPHVVRLRPAPHCRTPILAYALQITPRPHFLNWQQDPHGNFLARVVVPEKTQEFTATVDLVADMAILNPFDFFVDEQAVHWPFSYEPVLANELKPYLEPLPGTASFDRYLANIATPAMHMTTIDFVIGLNRRLSQAIAYRVRKETGVQTPEETLASGSGSCRDSGWLLVQVLRRVGLAARFVSGYLIQLRSDVAIRRRTGWRIGGFRRPAGLGRSLHTRSRMDRPRSHLGPARQRGAYSTRGDAVAHQRRSHRRYARRGGGRLFGQHACRAHARDAARHQTLQRRAVARYPGDWRRRREPAADGRRAPEHGRGADLRGARGWDDGGMEYGRTRSAANASMPTS